MPRDNSFIADMQKQRLNLKEKGIKYIPGTVNIQILGSGAPGAPASVYLFTDHTRYLFNCGEGTQRLAHEHKIKLSRLEHVFMTRTNWESIGGLPGLCLTAQDSGVPELQLHGAMELDELFRAMKRFIVLKNIKVKTINCENGGEYDDIVINVKYIPLKKSKKSAPQTEKNENNLDLTELDDDIDYYAYENENYEKDKVFLSNSKNADKLNSLANIKREEDTVICYICKLKPRPGTLNLEKCVEKGVPPGPLLGKLKNGSDVTLPNGEIVRADDVRGSTDPGAVFIFIDIPNESYLESLKENSKFFKDYQSNTTEEEKLASVVVHFSPQNIIETEIYDDFVNSFMPSTKHLVLNSENQFSGYIAANRIQWQLNQLNPYIFPLLKEKITLADSAFPPTSYNARYDISKNSISGNNIKNNLEMSNYEKVQSLTFYHLRPRKGLDHNFEPRLEPLEYIEESKKIDGFTESLNELRKTFKNYYKNITVKRHEDYPKIIFLGTGSCIPNKTRNVSSILLYINEDNCILLDCGEGTLGQLIRFYGYKNISGILKKLKAIYISHLHADHHMGLIGILLERKRILENFDYSPILLFAPKQIHSWLKYYNHRIQTITEEYELIPNEDMITEPLVNSFHEMGIKSIQTCYVKHCPYSYGVAINVFNKSMENDKNDSTIKISYSGDTMPCEAFVDLGQNSTVVIHEATMEDELINEAKLKMHSTVSQAIEQAQKMNAKYVILTHFSQRYAKLPRIEAFLEKNVIIAFDNMEITLNDLNCLHLMYPTLKIMFSDHCEDMEQKAIKRALRKERNRRASLNSLNLIEQEANLNKI